MDDPEFDQKRLHELRQLAGANFRAIVNSFEEDARKVLPRLQQAVAENDVSGIMDSAHALQGMGANIGATGLSRLGETLEMQARGNRVENPSEQLKGIENEYRRILEKLRG